MSNADTPVSAAEAAILFADLAACASLVVAVSGGPDSTALLFLIARWRAARAAGPRLLAVTVDHGLRAESAREARDVKRCAKRLDVPHRTARWTGDKPATGVQEAARRARYRLLAAAARSVGARHVLTAHTRDDQAETVLIRLLRGSGMTGLGAIARISGSAASGDRDVALVRPLLEIPKSRLLATLRAAGIGFVEDPSNRDPRFTRARLRGMMPALGREGLSAERLATLARRLRRADDAIGVAVGRAREEFSLGRWPSGGPIRIAARGFAALPAEIGLRLLGEAIAEAGDRPADLNKLEALYAVFSRSGEETARFRRTLAGALVTLAGDVLRVERAPARHSDRPAETALTVKRRDRGPIKPSR